MDADGEGEVDPIVITGNAKNESGAMPDATLSLQYVHILSEQSEVTNHGKLCGVSLIGIFHTSTPRHRFRMILS